MDKIYVVNVLENSGYWPEDQRPEQRIDSAYKELENAEKRSDEIVKDWIFKSRMCGNEYYDSDAKVSKCENKTVGTIEDSIICVEIVEISLI